MNESSMALSRPGCIIKSEVRTAVSNLWVELFVACPSGNFPSFHQQIEIKTHAIRALMLELLKMVDRGKIKRLSNYLWRWSYILDKAALIQHKAFRVRPYSKLETVAERRTVHLRGLRAPLACCWRASCLRHRSRRRRTSRVGLEPH